ncbi:lipid-A-disaccharide synthase [bacterium]|nr:lipid-A-disaccharide synthase [bacterium]
MTRSVYLVAAEASADVLGAEVIDALRRMDPDVEVHGAGLSEMRQRGAAAPVDLSDLSVLGFIDGLKAFGRVKAKVHEVATHVMTVDPDIVVLIDSWGFMWRLARVLKQRGARAIRVKLIGPQVWATRPGRARVLAEWCEHLFCIHAFEAPFYERWGLATTVIGNPAASRFERGDGSRFREAMSISSGAEVIGLLPGSRPAELRRVAPVLAAACDELCRRSADRMVLIVAAAQVEHEVMDLASTWTFPHKVVGPAASKPDAFAAMDLALACSGTVTTELAAQQTPMVVGYKVGWITWAIARAFLMKSRYVTLVNVAAGREIVPEFVQTRFTVNRLVRKADALLSDPDTLKAQREELGEVIQTMSPAGEGPAGVVARSLLQETAIRPRVSAAPAV